MTLSRLLLNKWTGMQQTNTVKMTMPTWLAFEMNGQRHTSNWWLWISKLLYGLDSTKNRYWAPRVSNNHFYKVNRKKFIIHCKNNMVMFWVFYAKWSLINLCFQTGGYFRYTDGWHLTLPNWGIMEPSTDRPCVYVDVDGAWKTADCSENKTSICMKSTGRTCKVYVCPKLQQVWIHLVVFCLEHYSNINTSYMLVTVQCYKLYWVLSVTIALCLWCYKIGSEIMSCLSHSQMWHQQSQAVSQDFALKTQTHPYIDATNQCGYHLRGTVTSFLQTELHGHMHLLAVYNMVRICVRSFLIS